VGSSRIEASACKQLSEDLTKTMGGAAATRDFARLFLVPGMDHCGIQSGPSVHHSGFNRRRANAICSSLYRLRFITPVPPWVQSARKIAISADQLEGSGPQDAV
jgi:hypothetical protein